MNEQEIVQKLLERKEITFAMGQYWLDPTKDDIEQIADELIEKNGNTTTLEIRDQLRTNGFFTTQAFVSEAMTELTDEEGLYDVEDAVTRGKQHRVFYEADKLSDRQEALREILRELVDSEIHCRCGRH